MPEMGFKRPEGTAGDAFIDEFFPDNTSLLGQENLSSREPTGSPPPSQDVSSMKPTVAREGTPKLNDALASSQVIRTYLPPLQTSGHRHQNSQEKDVISAESRSGVSKLA